MNYFWIKLKLLSTYPNFPPSFQLYYYFLCPCHQPFLSLIWWNLLSLSMWLVPVLIVFGLWLNMLCLIWRCWGSLIKWRIIGRGYRPTAYIPLSFTSLRSSSSSFVPWSLLLLSSSQWFPLESSVPAQLRFFKTSNLLFFFPLLILASSTFNFCSVSPQLLDIFFCLPPYSPLYKSFTFLCNLFWLNIVQQVLPVCASTHLNCWLSGQGDQRVSCTKMAFGL